jgi:hypothetical protein
MNKIKLDFQGYIFHFHERQIKIYCFYYHYHRVTMKGAETLAAVGIMLLQEAVFSVTMFSVRLPH